MFTGHRLASHMSTQEVLTHRARLFEEEQHKQLKAIERTEKIQVQVVEPGQKCTLIMNRHLSTPYSCALRNLIKINKPKKKIRMEFFLIHL